MHDDTTPRPSPRAVERLAGSLGEEVRDLRGALRRALEAADRLEADGRQDLAVAVLEEQRELLALVHQRLQTELAGAAVEREAESVLAAVAVEEPVVERPAPRALVPVEDDVVVGTAAVSTADAGRAMVGRLMASAAAAVLGIALLLTPNGPGGQVSIAGLRAGNGGSSSTDADERHDADEAAAAAEREAPTAALPTSDTRPAGVADEHRAAPSRVTDGGERVTTDQDLAATAPDDDAVLPAPTVSVEDLDVPVTDDDPITTIAPDRVDGSEDESEDEDVPDRAAEDDSSEGEASEGRADADPAPAGRDDERPPSDSPEQDDEPPAVVTGTLDGSSADAPSGAQPSTPSTGTDARDATAE